MNLRACRNCEKVIGREEYLSVTTNDGIFAGLYHLDCWEMTRNEMDMKVMLTAMLIHVWITAGVHAREQMLNPLVLQEMLDMDVVFVKKGRVCLTPAGYILASDGFGKVMK